MPLTAKGNEIMRAMKKEYGSRGEKVFYASKNAGKITGVDSRTDMTEADFSRLKELLEEFFDEEQAESEHRGDANSTAETESRWTIRGVYPDGKPLRFSVNAFDYDDAKKKAEQRKGGARITDIVLLDSRTDADSTIAKLDAWMRSKKVDDVYRAVTALGRKMGRMAHRTDARESNAQIAGKSALANLKTIHELAEEARGIDGNREANAVWVRNAGDCRRWVAALKQAGMDIPSFVTGNKSLIGI